MILITGATGTVGRDIVRGLSERGAAVRVMTRNPEQARSLPGFAKVEIVKADAADPETLGAAFAGVERAMLITGADQHWHQHQLHIIAAAQQAGVAHMTKLSVMGASAEQPAETMRSHYAGEQALAASGMAHTVLRPNVFLQNFAAFFLPSLKSDGVFYQCTGDQPLAQVDTRDIAAVAVRTLTEDGHAGQLYELTGPEPLRYSEAAARLSAVWGRPLKYIDVPGAAFVQAMTGVGVPGWLAEDIVNLYGRGFYGEGQGGRVTDTVARLLGRAPRSVEDFGRDYAHLFA